MAHQLQDIVLLGKETTRGTIAGTFPLDQPVFALIPTLSNPGGEILSNTGYPFAADVVPVGVTASLEMTPEVNRDTIRDLIDLVTKRTSGDQPQVSIKHGHAAGVTGTNPHMQYLGCVARSLRMNFSAGGQPSGESILQASVGLECMTFAAIAGVSAGTKANARKFQLRHSTITINSVAATKVLSLEHSIDVEHELGRVDASNARLFIQDGMESHAINLTGVFDTIAWRDLVTAATEHAVTIVFGTGTANETVTATIAKAQIQSRTLANQNGLLTQQVTIKPYSSSGVAWSYGSSIGASVLSL
ncbi:MAG: phage tail tube protein [Phycisphaerae bacterium]